MSFVTSAKVESAADTAVEATERPVLALAERLRLEGFRPGAPARITDRARSVDRLLCQHRKCSSCHRRGMSYMPLHRGLEYVAIAACNHCHAEEEIKTAAKGHAGANGAQGRHPDPGESPKPAPAPIPAPRPRPTPPPAMPAVYTVEVAPILAESVKLPQLLCSKELAKLLRVSKRTIWRWLDEGRLPQPIRYSRSCIRWREDVIARWMNENQSAR